MALQGKRTLPAASPVRGHQCFPHLLLSTSISISLSILRLPCSGSNVNTISCYTLNYACARARQLPIAQTRQLEHASVCACVSQSPRLCVCVFVCVCVCCVCWSLAAPKTRTRVCWTASPPLRPPALLWCAEGENREHALAHAPGGWASLRSCALRRASSRAMRDRQKKSAGEEWTVMVLLASDPARSLQESDLRPLPLPVPFFP